MTKPLRSEGAWARWGLLTSAVLLGVILIAASWSNYRSARAATTALHVGQARILEREIMGAFHWPPRLTEPEEIAAALDSLLVAQADQGLRYIALLDSEGGISLSVGESLGGPPSARGGMESERGFVLERVGSRVRMSLIRPRSAPPPPDPGDQKSPGREPRAADDPSGARPADLQAEAGPPPRDGAKPEPAERDSRRGHWMRHAGIVFEFDPVIASHVMDVASRLLVFGLAAAVVMMFVAGVSWGVSLRYERAKLHLEHERRLSLLGQMSAVLAHEIRNPLASLKGNAQLLAERIAPSSAERRKADRVVLEASRLEALTGDLLDFVRSGPLDRQAVDPRELVRAAAQEVSPDGFRLALDAGPSSWVLDPARMRQVLTNLLRNADQASSGSGQPAEVELHAEDDRLVITIRDQGEGLPAGAEDRIFEPFFTTRASGTGLGLAVARRIVELHGGTLTAENHAARGAVFRLTMPREAV